MFTDFGFQVCDKIYHLISQHFNPTFIEITCAELHEKLEVAATEEQIKNWLTVVNLFKPQTLLLEQVNYLNQQIDRSVTALSEKVKSSVLGSPNVTRGNRKANRCHTSAK